jgi:hypothetical protein
MDDVNLYKNLERDVARSLETQDALRRFSGVIASAAQARLARHRKTGEHQITRTQGKVDHFVNLEGPASLSVEVGHITKSGKFVEGLHILGGTL